MKKTLMLVAAGLIFAMIACGTVASMLTGTTAPVPTATAAPTATQRPIPTQRPTQMPTPDTCSASAILEWRDEALAIMEDAEPYMSMMSDDYTSLLNIGAPEKLMAFGDRFMDLDSAACTWDINQEMASAYYRSGLAVASFEDFDFDAALENSQKATAHFNEADRLIKLMNAGN